MTNIMLMADSYKLSHWLQYPPGTENVNSYIEARKGGDYDKSVFFGLQAYLKQYLLGSVLRFEYFDEAREFTKAHGVPFNEGGWNYIYSHKHGKLPVTIEAVAEGTVVPTGNVLLQIRATDPKCAWLVSYLETSLLRAIWYPTTVATISYHIKEVIYQYLKKTSDNPLQELPFKLHDFGARGVSSHESAELGGMAHLVNFMGSDTIEGVLAAKKYYHEPMAGFSIPASEHSTITAWGPGNEMLAHKNMLDKFAKPGTIVASVSDSYDLQECVKTIWGQQLKQQVINSGATIVVRPDSGDPLLVFPEVLVQLEKDFGSVVNSKGYRVLNHVRTIWGDGISLPTITEILDLITRLGYSAENVAFGMGGALLQHGNRDTMRFAMKASAINVGGYWKNIYKNPKTDPTKASKTGILSLLHTEGQGFWTTNEEYGATNYLRPVFEDGNLLIDEDFATIRARASEKFL